MEELQSELDQINVKVPSIEIISPTPVSNGDNPKSYTSNSKKEKVLLSFCINFQRQFRKLYGDRKALFLKPTNEHGVEKFICTTVRPTYLKHKELYEYDGCAVFVADYLTYEPLQVPNELPESLVSPTLVLKQQRGNCFDYAVLLCSLLVGVGYDAYCVCGYATQEVTQHNLTRKTCPQLMEKEETREDERKETRERYIVRPPRDLSSMFEKRMVDKERSREEEERRKKQEEEDAKRAEAEAPPPDKWHGLRFHCWVIVLPGKREVAQGFFIEPTTGESLSLDCDEYLGIESLWNHKNYWINMQDCSQGVKTLSYDLGDATQWEFFFPNVDKPLLVVPGDEPTLEDEEELEDEDIKEYFELPPSWVLPIQISAKELENRCPNGKKTTLYYRSKVEKSAEYLNQDGLVTCFTVYADTARTSKVEIKNYFKHRTDCLLSRVLECRNHKVRESFAPGRQRSLKEHEYYETKSQKSNNRTFLFYSYARVDGLAKRDLTATEMVEEFKDRPDYLYYRHVTYEKPVKKFEPSVDKGQPYQIVKIVEKFHHDPSIPPNSDIAERTFLVRENRITVVYHLEENRITPSTREFVIPQTSGDQIYTLTFDHVDMPSPYQVDPYLKEPKKRVLYEQLEQLIKAQEESIATIRASEQETQAILNARLKEELNISLSISVYDVARNEMARKHRKEQEAKKAEEERIRKEKEMDYLAPFLARIGDPPKPTKQQMEEVTQDCLKDLRGQLVEMANIIQNRFEQETEDLQRKQAEHKNKQGSITKEDEEDYVVWCNEAIFRIHILEQRLNRHKMTAPQKYMELEQRMRSDPRLAPLFYP